MKSTVLIPLVSLLAAGAVRLAPKYEAEKAVRVTVETRLESESATEMERDGEPVDRGSMEATSDMTWKEVHVDKVIEVDKELPARVRRTFESVGAQGETTFGENSREIEHESPFEGAVIEIARDAEGAVEVEIVEGKDLTDEDVARERAACFLDGLLPPGEVEEGATWELSKEAIARALRLDVHAAMYRPPQREEGEGEGRGGRGGRGMRGGGPEMDRLASADWTGTARLASTATDVDGVSCAVVELELECSGTFEPPARGFGGRRRDQAPAAGTALAPINDGSFDAKLTGRLRFAVEARRVHSLELDGSFDTETNMEMSRGESTMRIHTRRDGKLQYRVAVETAQAD